MIALNFTPDPKRLDLRGDDCAFDASGSRGRGCGVGIAPERGRHFTKGANHACRRALLFMPGDDRRKIEKGAALGVDSVIMDLEDGVALNNKAAARETIALRCAKSISAKPSGW